MLNLINLIFYCIHIIFKEILFQKHQNCNFNKIFLLVSEGAIEILDHYSQTLFQRTQLWREGHGMEPHG